MGTSSRPPHLSLQPARLSRCQKHQEPLPTAHSLDEELKRLEQKRIQRRLGAQLFPALAADEQLGHPSLPAKCSACMSCSFPRLLSSGLPLLEFRFPPRQAPVAPCYKLWLCSVHDKCFFTSIRTLPCKSLGLFLGDNLLRHLGGPLMGHRSHFGKLPWPWDLSHYACMAVSCQLVQKWFAMRFSLPTVAFAEKQA